MSASRLYELVQALNVPVQYFLTALKALFFANRGPQNVLAMIDGTARVSSD